ncbi:hypothetical protein, partial [Saccharibacter floricola]|uniref:hypothetical protein n=1 Tax=Saccharibacter floricola TaxID=231053 RepID=UPI0022305BA8
SAIQQYNQANEDQAEKGRRDEARAHIAEETGHKGGYVTDARTLGEDDLPAGYTFNGGSPDGAEPDAPTTVVTDRDGNEYDAVTNHGQALVDSRGDTIFRSSDGRYYSFYDGQKRTPQLGSSDWSWNSAGSLVQDQVDNVSITDPVTGQDIARIVRDENDAETAPSSSHAHGSSLPEESSTSSDQSKTGRGHRSTSASSSSADSLSRALENSPTGSSTAYETEPTDNRPSILSTHASDGTNESTPEQQWMNQVADSISHAITTHGGLMLDVGSALPGVGLGFTGAKVVWDIEHGDSNAAKIDLLMGAISATGLDV